VFSPSFLISIYHVNPSFSGSSYRSSPPRSHRCPNRRILWPSTKLVNGTSPVKSYGFPVISSTYFPSNFVRKSFQSSRRVQSYFCFSRYHFAALRNSFAEISIVIIHTHIRKSTPLCCRLSRRVPCTIIAYVYSITVSQYERCSATGAKWKNIVSNTRPGRKTPGDTNAYLYGDETRWKKRVLAVRAWLKFRL